MKRRIIIPARLASTRLPQKLLIPIAGKPLIAHTYARALQCHFDSVVIATDDEQIAEAARAVGAPVCMTAEDHLTGTDRCAEAFNTLGYADDDVVVCMQGDEPLLPVANITCVAQNLENYLQADMTTLSDPIDDRADLFNPHCVKVVFDKANYALYFSRAPIPWARENFPADLPNELHFFRHVGIYAYRGKFLKNYPQLERSPLEILESLEQLRALWHGYKIHVDIAPVSTPPGVDTLDSFKKVQAILEGGA
jgi:3-deoxy-manno-octulosonate cytidylyltransferase (CMP-KDO synthetase)